MRPTKTSTTRDPLQKTASRVLGVATSALDIAVRNLDNVLAHEDQPDPAHLTKVSPWFERSLAIGELTASDLKRFPSPRVFKSHLPREWLPDGARYIYVERDGVDVLVSYFHFYCAYLGFEGTLDDFHRRFMDGRVQYGSWFDHVAGWREHASD
ncbi:MAG: sulfotransferase domain-containing protein, partial [Deltaproteobacteria bacterium]|nr:sulfotransferase domain-containing protein [Deltaproteobacteria bacterium]